MGISPSRECVGFGIEIELSGIPRDVDVQPRKEWDYKRAGFRALKSAMESQGIGTTMDPINKNGSFMKHPETYEFWHLTQDSSIEPEDKPDAISIEAVSRVFLVPQKDWMREIGLFWNAFDETFEQELRNESCGSHVHVRPMGLGYDLEELKRIAYAVVVYEKHVLEFLPEERKDHPYCNPNTKVSPALKRIFRHGRTRSSYDDLRDQIYDLDTSEELCTFMQGVQNGNRRVLWNFDNVSDRTGTIEFRGGPGLHDKRETIRWILFAVGFILLAIEENKFSEGDFSYVAPGTPLFQRRANELWARIRSCTARRVTRKWILPEDYDDMRAGYGTSSRASSISNASY